MTIQQIRRYSDRGRISVIKIQNFTIQRRHSVIKLVYGSLMVIFGMLLATLDPLEKITAWFMDIQDGSFVFRMWQEPPYAIHTEVYIFNYTNVPQFLDGTDKVLKVQEIGPFTYLEKRMNLNMSVDRELGLMRYQPNVSMSFVRDQSYGDIGKLHVTVPNIALIALSTLAADKLGYLANAGAYYSLKAMGAKLFMNMTVEDFLWGYDDPIVTLANNLLPGWIDFGKIGILDRFYSSKMEMVEAEIKDESRKFSINTWDGSAGLPQRGFTDLNSSTLCNRIQGSYEGLLVAPNIRKDQEIPIFRKQACRVYPFVFGEEASGDLGVNYYRFKMSRDAFSRSSPYACECTENCVPDGFIDISNCYYSFPITLSKPHFLDADPTERRKFQGLIPDREKHTSYIDVVPSLGVPITIYSNMQVNLAVRTNPGNPLVRSLKDTIVPLVWISLQCREPSPDVATILKLRFVIGPPLVITSGIIFLIIGIALGAVGFYRIWKPKYKLIESEPAPKRKISNVESAPKRKISNVVINMTDNIGFNNDEELAKEAVSLLSIQEEDNDWPDLIMRD